MNIAIERKDLLKQFDCLICNQLESSILFSRDYGEISVEELSYTLLDELQKAEFNSLIVTLGEAGSLYVKNNGECGFCQARKIEVKRYNRCRRCILCWRKCRTYLWQKYVRGYGAR